jgi:hypothetical protein
MPTQIQERFARIARHNPETTPGAQKAPCKPTYKSRAISLLTAEKTLIGLANTFGGFVVWVLYVVQR